TSAGSDSDRHRAPARSARRRRPFAGAGRGPSEDDRSRRRSRRAPHWTQSCGECGVSDVVALQPMHSEAGNPRAEIRAGLLVAILFFVVFLGWAAFVPLDAGVSAPGTVAVLGNRQTVQHKDGGVITAIRVREGQHVQAGQVVVELSAPELKAAERALTSDYLTLLAQRARLLAERNGQHNFAPPAEFASLSPADREIAAQVMQLQRSEM